MGVYQIVLRGLEKLTCTFILNPDFDGITLHG
jgi:hypothetical protein